MAKRFEVAGRFGSSPFDRGSATGQTCPDFLPLEGGTMGVIGELPEPSEEALDGTRLVVPAILVHDALTHILRS